MRSPAFLCSCIPHFVKPAQKQKKIFVREVDGM